MISLLAGCQTRTETTQPAAVKTPATYTTIALKPMAETLELNGVTSFSRKNIVKASATSHVENSYINLGDMVEKGQVLFTLKTKEAAAYDKNMMSDSTFAFKGEITIKAQKSGVISSITHQRGDYVQEGDELAQLSEQSSLVFMLQVPFELIEYIKINEKCQIQLSDNRVIGGVISRRLPVMDVQSQTENFVVEPLTSINLPENLIAKISILKSAIHNTPVLPKEAILADETLTSFWVMKLLNDSVAVKVPIKKGIEANNDVEILEPTFTPADRILFTGNYGMTDTAKVSIK